MPAKIYKTRREPGQPPITWARTGGRKVRIDGDDFPHGLNGRAAPRTHFCRRQGKGRAQGRKVLLRSGAGAAPVSPCAGASGQEPAQGSLSVPHTARSVPAAARRSRSGGPGAPFHHALNHTIMPRWPEPSSPPQTPPPSRCTADKETRRSNSILFLGCDQKSGHFSPKENTSAWCNCQGVKAFFKKSLLHSPGDAGAGPV